MTSSIHRKVQVNKLIGRFSPHWAVAPPCVPILLNIMNVTKVPRPILSVCILLFGLPLYAAIPQAWYSSTPTNKNLTAAFYGQGQYIVVGWGSMIIKSPSGFSWTQAMQL